jgi:hypothetical protein
LPTLSPQFSTLSLGYPSMAQRRPALLYTTFDDPTAAASASESLALAATGTHVDTVDFVDPFPKSTTTAT